MHYQAPPPTIAVIIAYYNGSRDIERALKSVYAQTILPEQVIIVDDGSREEESAFLKTLNKTYAFELYSKENGGQGSARNFGVAHSKQNYICFLDQDDYFLPNHIADLVSALPQNDPRFGYVYAELCTADANGKIINSHFLRDTPHIQKRHPKDGALMNLLRHDLYIFPAATLIAKSAYDAIGGFDTQFMGYEDDDLFLRFYCAGFSNYFFASPVTVWCVHHQSTTFSVLMSQSRLRFLKKWAVECPDNLIFFQFYFKNALFPRLFHNFLSEMIQTLVRNAPDQDQYFANWLEFIKIVKAHSSISIFTKIALDVLTIALKSTPRGLLKKIRPIYYGLKRLRGKA